MMQTRSLLLLVVFLFFGSVGRAETPPMLTTDQKKALREAIASFRKAETEDEQNTLSQTILDMGPYGAKDLLKVVEKEFESNSRRYLKAFGKAAKKRKPKLSRDQKKEVETARATLTALREEADLTKEAVVQRGDPALAKLKELLLVTPEGVRKEESDLAQVRATLLRLSGYMDRCKKLTAQLVKTDKPKKKKGKRGDAVAPDPVLCSAEESLALQEQTILLIELLAEKQDEKVLERNLELGASIDRMEAQGVLDLNRMRLLLGSGALTIDVALCEAARDHSNDMRTKNFFAHESPVPGKKEFFTRAKLFGAKARAENIAKGQQTPEGVNLSWFHSPGHHKNMLNPGHRFMGLGYSERLWTQLFR